MEHSMRYCLHDVTRNFLGMDSRRDNLREHEFWALQNVSFSLYQGEALAIIGKNGAGKSTLLKTVQGIYEPDKGDIYIHDRMTELVELGTSFHHDYTGRENIWINASVLGLSDKEIKNAVDSIIAFADIGDFINSPVKYYSTGMRMRLAFSIAVHCPSSILLVDEILNTGDAEFVEKCHKKIDELLSRGASMILVTHNLEMAKKFSAQRWYKICRKWSCRSHSSRGSKLH